MTTVPGSVDERRRHRRYTYISEVRGERLTPVPAGPFDVTVSNICRSGLMLHTDFGFFLSPGYQIRLTFSEDHLRTRLEILAKVVWMRHHGLRNCVGRWALGAAFEVGQDKQVKQICDLAETQWNESND